MLILIINKEDYVVNAIGKNTNVTNVTNTNVTDVKKKKKNGTDRSICVRKEVEYCDIT